ncbi:MAG: septum formation initiator family protein [Candidatus Aminicenantes bacterium]|nr:septum formation initiator family protein [Candidatus Aminicenantes bacterium]
MNRSENKQISLHRRLVMAAICSVFLIVLIATFFGQRGLLEKTHVQKRLESLSQEKQILLEEKKDLERDIEELQNNPNAVENKAREKLWYGKPGEVIILTKEKH